MLCGRDLHWCLYHQLPSVFINVKCWMSDETVPKLVGWYYNCIRFSPLIFMFLLLQLWLMWASDAICYQVPMLRVTLLCDCSMAQFVQVILSMTKLLRTLLCLEVESSLRFSFYVVKQWMHILKWLTRDKVILIGCHVMMKTWELSLCCLISVCISGYGFGCIHKECSNFDSIVK